MKSLVIKISIYLIYLTRRDKWTTYGWLYLPVLDYFLYDFLL